MSLKDKQKQTADSDRTVQRGSYFMHSGRHLAVIRKLKYFESHRSGNSMAVLEWQLKVTDNPKAEECVGETFSWVADLNVMWPGEVYPYRDRLQLLVESLVGGKPAEPDDEFTDAVDAIYDAIEEDEYALEGAELTIVTAWTKTQKDEDFLTYSFEPYREE